MINGPGLDKELSVIEPHTMVLYTGWYFFLISTIEINQGLKTIKSWDKNSAENVVKCW